MAKNVYHIFLMKESRLHEKLKIHSPLVKSLNEMRKELDKFITKKYSNLPDLSTDVGLDLAVKQISAMPKGDLNTYGELTRITNEKWFQIYWTTLPSFPEYVFGSCNGGGLKLLKKSFMKRSAPMNYMFMRSNISKWYVITVNKELNSGNIMTMFSSGKVKVEKHDSSMATKHGYDKYAYEMERDTGIPFFELYEYLHERYPFTWDNEVVVDLESLLKANPNLIENVYTYA